MNQIKVSFNNEIKRTIMPDSHQEFTVILRKLFKISNNFSAYYFDKNGLKILISESTYLNFKNYIENCQTTVKIFVEPQIEIDYSFKPIMQEKKLPESLLSRIQDKIDYGYNNFIKLYQDAKMPELVENIKTESHSIFNQIQDQFNKTFCFQEEKNPENNLYEIYKEQLGFIRNNYIINRNDKEILLSLQKNNGDIDKTFSDLFH